MEKRQDLPARPTLRNMCGRVALFSPPSRLARFTQALTTLRDDEWSPSWNLPPQRPLFVVRTIEKERQLVAHTWGLVPSWARSPAQGARLANARAETVAEKPSFRQAFAERPCVIPVDGYYEWRVDPHGLKLPHYFTRRDGETLLLAGLFERWRDERTGTDLLTCCVVTTAPSEDVVAVHDRMPLVLRPDDLDGWLEGDASVRHALLHSAPAGTLQHHEVSRRVNSVRFDDAQLIAPQSTATLF